MQLWWSIFTLRKEIVMTKKDVLFSDKRGFKIFVTTIICDIQSHTQTLGKYLISRQSDFYGLVNKETMQMEMFCDESRAIDSMLDKYNEDKKIQNKLF